ncbi:MAG: hypothetical protein LBS31_01740, partial [Candidatus Adiutrix sp.]|nr:hypothetical protein [Candidatus Adiutrix sp.]
REELFAFVIHKIDTAEQDYPLVVRQAERSLFRAVNRYIAARVNGQSADWQGKYALGATGNGETYFAPPAWVTGPNQDEYQAWYSLDGGPKDEYFETCPWLSVALGRNEHALRLQFDFEAELLMAGADSKEEMIKQLYAAHPQLGEGGLLYDDNEAAIYRPFSFEATALRCAAGVLTLPAACPWPSSNTEALVLLDTALAPLNEALNSLFAAHHIFDEFVMTKS